MHRFAANYVEEADEFGRTSAYKDLLLNVRYRGHVCEIQVALTQLAEMKKQAHKFYKVWRAANAGELFGMASSMECPKAQPGFPRTASSHGKIMAALRHSLKVTRGALPDAARRASQHDSSAALNSQ